MGIWYTTHCMLSIENFEILSPSLDQNLKSSSTYWLPPNRKSYSNNTISLNHQVYTTSFPWFLPSHRFYEPFPSYLFLDNQNYTTRLNIIQILFLFFGTFFLLIEYKRKEKGFNIYKNQYLYQYIKII